MPELSYNDFERISRDIRKEDITFSHLLDELIDHVCCDVENEMSKGLSFKDAYNIVRQKIGPRRFKEIQEETLYAIDSKYRKMKNTMKISGIAGTVMFGFAALFKIQHWPMAGVLMTFGAFTLAFVFLPSALGVLWKETKNKGKLFLFLTAFLTGFCFIAGTLFKVQHWPFAGFILTIGAITGILFFIPALLINRMSDPDSKPKRPAYILGTAGSMLFLAGFIFKIQHWPFATLFMVTSMILLCMVAFPWYTWITWREDKSINPVFIFLVVGSLLIIIPSALINLNLQHSYQEYYYPNNIRQQLLYNHLFRNNNSLVAGYTDSLGFPKLKEVHSRTMGVINIINGIQGKMVRESEGENGKPAVSENQIRQTEAGQEIVFSELTYVMDIGPSRNYLFPGTPGRTELSNTMSDFVDFLSGFVPADELQKYKRVLDPESYLPSGNPDSGETSLISGLHSLEIMKNGLLTVESSVLNTIISHK